MESESDCDCCGWSSGSESEREDSWESSVQERWETVAGLMQHAHGMCRLEALETVLPHLPAGPQASAIERALVNSNSLQTTLRAAEKVAIAMARVEELLELL